MDSIVSVPVNVPTAVGVNVTPAEQVPVGGATGVVHRFVGVRLGSPVTVTLVMPSGPYPTLEIVRLGLAV